jgi:enoyl-CoA hydratase/carnithine racemase
MTDISTQIIANGLVAIVSIDRPKKFNALNWETFAKLKVEIENLGKTGSQVRCIILTGTGKHFTAGLDLTSAMDL